MKARITHTAQQVKTQAMAVDGKSDFMALAAEKLIESLERQGRVDAASRLRLKLAEHQNRQMRNFKMTGK